MRLRARALLRMGLPDRLVSVAGARGFSGTGGQELNLMNDIYLIAGVGEDVFDSVLVS